MKKTLLLIIMTIFCISCGENDSMVDAKLNSLTPPVIVIATMTPDICGFGGKVKVRDGNNKFHTIYSKTLCYRTNEGDTLKK